MAKCALSLFIKISLFAVVMVLVAKYIPYDGLTDYFTSFFDFQSAEKVTRFILGEPDPEFWESLKIYFAMLINTLISIPLLSAFITAYYVSTQNISATGILRNWGTSTLRRFIKLFSFTFLFWVFFRILPYQSFLPDNETYATPILIAVVIFNLLITIACYWFITQKTIIKRSL
jgi:hypothetical protein